MSITALIDAMRSAQGYAGMAIYAGGTLLFSERIAAEHTYGLGSLLGASDVRRVSATISGVTLVALKAGGSVIVLKLDGRFPPVPDISVLGSDLTSPGPLLSLPTRAEARREAEAALRRFGLLD